MMSREKYVFLARLCDQAERYEEMIDHMKCVVKMGPELNADERGLLSSGYKNVIARKRSSWRIINGAIKQFPTLAECIQLTKARIEDEINRVCMDAHSTIQEAFKYASSYEGVICLFKMDGDYFRYMTEFKGTDNRSEISQQAENNYMKAFTLSKKHLSPIHPVRLGVALNYSVFVYEIQGSCEVACKIAKETYDRGIAYIDEHPKELSKDAALILQLLSDNITLWRIDDGKEGEEIKLEELKSPLSPFSPKRAVTSYETVDNAQVFNLNQFAKSSKLVETNNNLECKTLKSCNVAPYLLSPLSINSPNADTGYIFSPLT